VTSLKFSWLESPQSSPHSRGIGAHDALPCPSTKPPISTSHARAPSTPSPQRTTRGSRAPAEEEEKKRRLDVSEGRISDAADPGTRRGGDEREQGLGVRLRAGAAVAVPARDRRRVGGLLLEAERAAGVLLPVREEPGIPPVHQRPQRPQRARRLRHRRPELLARPGRAPGRV
jgi:hypothetical protein